MCGQLLSSRQFRRHKCLGNPHEIRIRCFLSYRFLSNRGEPMKVEAVGQDTMSPFPSTATGLRALMTRERWIEADHHADG